MFSKLFNNKKLNLKSNGNYKIISLGEDCSVRRYLTIGGLKPTKDMGELTMPFDLAVNNIRTVIHFLETDFKDYFENLVYTSIGEHDGVWINDKYGVLYNHDKDCKECDIQKFTDRFSKRINNLKATLNEPVFLYFVIKTTNDYRYINKLYDLLIRIRRKSLGTNEESFKLIVLDWMNQINIKKINKNIALFKKLHPFEKQEDWWKPEVMNSKVSLDYQKNICNFVENIISEDFEIKRYKSVDVNNEDGEY